MRIIIKGMQLEAIIGVYPHEREVEQPLIIDIIAEYDGAHAAQTDDVSHAVDYDHIMEAVKTCVVMCQPQLLETLLVKVAEMLLQEFARLDAVEVSISKPHAAGSKAAMLRVSHSQTR